MYFNYKVFKYYSCDLNIQTFISSITIKIKSVQDFFEGNISISDVCKELNITRSTFYWWITKYNLNGAEGLRQTSQNTKYPKEINLLC